MTDVLLMSKSQPDYFPVAKALNNNKTVLSIFLGYPDHDIIVFGSCKNYCSCIILH